MRVLHHARILVVCEFADRRSATSFATFGGRLLPRPIWLMKMVVGSGRKRVLVDLFDPEVVQASDQPLLLAGPTGLLLDARESRQPAPVLRSVRSQRGLGGLLWVPLRWSRLILRVAQHLLPVNGSLLPLRQLSLLRNARSQLVVQLAV